MSSENGSLCATHPERAATGVCERCGVFGCGECLTLLGELRLCAACRAREAVGLPSLAGRARLAMPFVWATAGLGLVVSLLSFGVPAEGSEDPGAVPQVVALGCSGILYLGVFITGVVLFCRWFHLLVRHAKAGGAPLDTTPAAAVGSFFIPFVNLVRPYAIAKQISTTSTAASAVGQWQALWIGANIVTNVGARLEGKTGSSAGELIGLFGSLLFLGAAWACQRVVAELTKTTELTPESSGPSASAPAPSVP
ncbi:MAG: DUF4328 domain-containing protein [Myxococcaceae bacterium]|nr:DUF4328 domain-containing protein [Myxococcaceae bacterium]